MNEALALYTFRSKKYSQLLINQGKVVFLCGAAAQKKTTLHFIEKIQIFHKNLKPKNSTQIIGILPIVF